MQNSTISYIDGEEQILEFPVLSGNLKNLKVNGEDILQTHDIAKKTETLSRQIRVIAVLASLIAIAVLVLVSLIYHYEDNQKRNLATLLINEKNHHIEMINAVHSRQHLASRLYELTGNTWVKDKWVVDPNWVELGTNLSPRP